MKRGLGIGLALVTAVACGPAPDDMTIGRTNPGTCVTCHLSDYLGASKHSGVKPTACATCHEQSGWHPQRLNHSWPLTGKHAKASCFGCHKGNPTVYTPTTKLCVDCHTADRDKANATVNSHSRFAANCAECHSTEAWKPTLPREAAPPTAAPSTRPSAVPTAAPTLEPKPRPTAQPRPVVYPTAKPTPTPTPTPVPTPKPTPTKKPPDVVSKPS